MNIKTQNQSSPGAQDLSLSQVDKGEKTRQLQTGDAQSPSERVSSVRSKAGYAVALSPESQSLKEAHQKAYDIAINTPEVREDRINAIRDRIQNGTYEVDSGKIADGMLREAVKDKLAQSD